MLHDTYTRENAQVRLEIIGRWDSESLPENDMRQVNDIMARIRRTLDIIPTQHIYCFGKIRLNSNLRSGGGHNPNIPHIQLSYDCFTDTANTYNQGDYSYTLLHEMGHMVDKKLYDGLHRIRALSTGFPQGCLAMLSRYHSGGTVGASEHYADIYADYYFTRVGGVSGWGVHRRDGDGCPSCRGEHRDHSCINYRNACRRRLGNSASQLPSGRELTELRYRALLTSLRSRDIQEITSTSDTIVPETAPHAAVRAPQEPGRMTYYEPGDQFIWR